MENIESNKNINDRAKVCTIEREYQKTSRIQLKAKFEGHVQERRST